MSFYLDASVIVPSLIAEPASPRIKRWLSETEGEFILSDLAQGEVISALYRAVREGREQLDSVVERIAIFDRWRLRTCTTTANMLLDTRTVIDHVRRFDLGLRMPDSIHLAACERLELTLVTFDRRLLRAADALGIAATRPS